ncbi:hypothetical protein A3Q56_01482 [Intoshia linei]|uniref:Uncharacterized protein n=1 Tax=Intoshia linei TaxID=1819745 RepID=A0A177BB86_9BILA|nr:hypothetical protein A3Q56_01482 [Intoshia linei]
MKRDILNIFWILVDFVLIYLILYFSHQRILFYSLLTASVQLVTMIILNLNEFTKNGSKIVKSLLYIPVFHIILILFGAPFVDKFIESIGYSIVLTVLLSTYARLCQINYEKCRHILFTPFKKLEISENEIFFMLVAVFTIIGTIFGPFSLILDWSVDWNVFFIFTSEYNLV